MSAGDSELETTSMLFDEEERSRILSTARLKVMLSIFVVALLLGLGALFFIQVSRIFDQLTPAVAKDLSWKSERGSAELSFTTELAVVLGEKAAIAKAARTYINDEDVESLVVLDAEGKVLFTHPEQAGTRSSELFSGVAGSVRESPDSYITWALVDIEGAEIGKVALEVSKRRLKAGAELRQDILKGVAGGSLVAFLIALSFVSFYIAPLVRVTERAFIDLQQRTSEALESARLKSEFLANMSHEIRTPMNGVIGMGELLQKTSLSMRQRRYVRTISTSALALLTIINDILDFSKIDAGKLSVRPVETDVKALAEEVSQLLAPLGQSKGVEVMVSIASDLPREVMVDHDRLRQVLNNVMGNAVKFTTEGSVVLRVWIEEQIRDDDSCVIGFSVTDTGIGIAKEDQSRVFEHFSQADGSLTRTAGGTGLGLSISRHLVDLMGGCLSLTSELGKGSCFSFSLRCAVVSGERSKPGGRLPRTLIVDDSGTNRTVLEEVFESWGVPNDSARSAAEALEMLVAAESEGKPFELALLDHVMDGVDGPTLAHQIREKLAGPPRLVLVTSMADSGTLDSVFDEGLTKPVLQDDLKRVVKGGESGARIEVEEEVGRIEFVGNPRVLVAEDNAINREVMREILKELNLQVDLVEDGKEAVEAVEAHSYPLILMDCQMPIMDGYEATRQIRRRDDMRSETPIVAVTAHAVQGEREKAIAVGMTDYITKPVTITRLVRIMARYLPTQRSTGNGSFEPGELASHSLVPPVEEGPLSQRGDRLKLLDPGASEELPPEAPQAEVRENEAPALDPKVRRSPTVVRLFRRIVPEQVESLHQVVQEGDSEGVKQVAHKLKGSCLALGARQMGAICAQLEPNPDGAAALLGQLVAEHARVLEGLSAEEATSGS